MRTELSIVRIALLAIASLASISAQAIPFSEIRIGDRDGFGFGTGASSCPDGACQAANGGLANVGSGGVLGAESGAVIGDFLPDLDRNGSVDGGFGDSFDNRLNENVSGAGFLDTGTSGTQFTDISLALRYDDNSSAGRVYDANTGTFGSGGAFPMAPSGTRPNQPGFGFRFEVDQRDIDPDRALFFNVVFGDFDVIPFDLELTLNDGTGHAGVIETISITPQDTRGGEDGLIQVAFAELTFSDVFSDPGTGAYTGFLDVTFDADNEPYTAYDFVELSTDPITTSVPLPGTWFLLVAGLLGLVRVQRVSKMP